MGTSLPNVAPTAATPVGQTFARQATGLVREVRLLDMVAYNASASTPAGIVMAIGIFSIFLAFPGANVLLCMGISALLLPFVWVAFSLLAATMPGFGGDYLFGSRILHPVAGLFSNVCTYLGALLSLGLVGLVWVQFGLVAELGIIGSVTGNEWWTNLATDLSTKWWTFGLSALLLLAISLLAIRGTKSIARTMAVAYYVSLAGAFVAVLILLFTSHGHFVSTINDIGGPTAYDDTLKAGAEGGLVYPSDSGFSGHNTLGAMYLVLLTLNAVWYGIFLSGEMKGGGRRGRQLVAQLGTGYGQLLFVFIGIAAFIHATGSSFAIAASNGFFPVPVAPYFNYFASVISGSAFVAVILGFAFLFALPAWMYGNLAMCQRAPFAWAFDGLLPRAVARVNPRTHTPVNAIIVTFVLGLGAIALASFSTNFLQFLAYAGVTGLGTFVMCGIFAMLLPNRPAIFNNSPADWQVGGVNVIRIAGVGLFLIGLFMIWLLLEFHTNLGVTHLWIPGLTVLGEIIFAIGLYYGARAIQRRRGVDIDLAYRSLPVD
jgi:APA family basic amino acid/polyamine antiporter